MTTPADNDPKVTSFEAFKARHDLRRQEPKAAEPKAIRHTLSAEEIAHRFVMLAHLRRQVG
jgi:hypothetical protein